MLVALSLPVCAGSRYQFSDLGPGGNPGMNAHCHINNAGQVAAFDYVDGGFRAYLWQDGVKQYLSDRDSTALSTKSGITVGFDYSIPPVKWEGGISQLLPFGAESDSQACAFDLNAQGAIVGVSGSDLSLYYNKPVVWTGDEVSVLPLGDAQHGGAYAINESGAVAGYTRELHYTSYKMSAAIWVDGELQMLGGLSESNTGSAFDINELGHVVGWSHTHYTQNAFYWADGEMQALEMSDPYYQHSAAYAINNSDQMVGWISQPTGSHAAIWENGSLSDLNDLVDLPAGSDLEYAWDINDSGQILATAYIYDESRQSMDERLLVLTPVPEPSALMALLCGFGAAGLGRRFRHMQRHSRNTGVPGG